MSMFILKKFAIHINSIDPVSCNIQIEMEFHHDILLFDAVRFKLFYNRKLHNHRIKSTFTASPNKNKSCSL